MQSVNNFIGNGILWGVVTVVVFTRLYKSLNPNVASAAKNAASRKALSVLSKLLK
jgi:hypothetical protein